MDITMDNPRIKDFFDNKDVSPPVDEFDFAITHPHYRGSFIKHVAKIIKAVKPHHLERCGPSMPAMVTSHCDKMQQLIWDAYKEGKDSRAFRPMLEKALRHLREAYTITSTILSL